MAIIKNTGHIPDLPDNATDALIEEVQRTASAVQKDVIETQAYEEKEISEQKAQNQNAKQAKAGAEHNDKLAEADPSQVIAAELATPASLSVGATVLEGFTDRKTDTANKSDIVGAKAKGDVSQHAESMQGIDKRIAKAPIQPKIETSSGRSLIEKTGTGSLKELTKSKGVADNGAATNKIQVSEVKKTISVSKSLANESKLARANALDREGQAPTGPGGMGQNHQQLALNKMEPPPPNFKDDTEGNLAG